MLHLCQPMSSTHPLTCAQSHVLCNLDGAIYSPVLVMQRFFIDGNRTFAISLRNCCLHLNHMAIHEMDSFL